jgi:hypothetical protein
MNPTLNPTLLQIGTQVTFPLFCKCPSKSHVGNGITNLMITYVWQPTDDVFHVSAKFNASPADIEAENGYGKNFSAAVGLPVLIPMSQLPALSQSYPPQQSDSKHHWIFLVLVMSLGGAVLMFLLITLLVEGTSKKRSL